MRAKEFTAENEPIKIGNDRARAQAWIERVYAKYPYTMQNNHVMTWGEGEDQQFAMFELVPSFSQRGAVEVKWFQAYPLRQGVGSRAMKELQALAREDGIALTLFPWDKGQVSQAKLTKFYKGQGYKPINRGGKAMSWTPEVDEGIEKLRANEYTGGKSSLGGVSSTVKYDITQKLPGNSGFIYTTRHDNYGSFFVEIWDPNGQDYILAKSPPPEQEPGEPDWKFKGRYESFTRYAKRVLSSPGQQIGKLMLERTSWFPIPNAVTVDVITVDEDYRGQGIARALYSVVLKTLKYPLISGDSQTPGGRRNWASLASMPGVEVRGYIVAEKYNLDPSHGASSMMQKQAEKNIDTIMGKLGGDYIGKTHDDRHVFAFDIALNTTGQEVQAYVKTYLSKIYGDTYFQTGLYAIESGQ